MLLQGAREAGMSGKIDDGGMGRVLIVDDARVVRAVVARTLSRAGYQTEEAANGAEALRRLAAESYDVVITDLRMPELGGLELLASVKRLAPTVEVIILTGTHAQDMSYAVKALRLGAHDYLTKPPSSPDEVVLTVQRAVEKKRLHEANQRLLRELESLSRTDALTGAGNRRSFDDALGHEMARAKRHGQALSLVMLDIDHFKAINDTHGHQGGDEVLRAVARTLRATLRDGDVLYRYGGEEFAMLLPYAQGSGACTAAERMLRALAATPVHLPSGAVKVTASAGVATLSASDADGASLIARADAALYEAKKAGRNRVEGGRPALTLVGGQRAV
jgi:two-component system, cell cycle response regulator